MHGRWACSGNQGSNSSQNSYVQPQTGRGSFRGARNNRSFRRGARRFPQRGYTINQSLESIAPTPIDIGALESELDSYDSPDAAIILDGFKNWFKIYYEGPHEPTVSKNVRSANQYPEVVHQKIQK